MSFSIKKMQNSLKKWLIPGLGLQKYKMRLEHFAVPENKEVLKECWGYVKKAQKPTVESLRGYIWLIWILKEMMMISDYNIENKIGI